MKTYSLELYRHQLGDAHIFHSYTVKCSGHLHRPLVMSDNDELRVSGHLNDLISKASNVRFVKWRVDLVEQAERSGPVMEDTQHQSQSGHCLLTTRQQQHILEPLPWRLGNHIDSRFEDIIGIDQAHFAAATPK